MGNSNYPHGVTDFDFMSYQDWEFQHCETCAVPHWIPKEYGDCNRGYCHIQDEWVSVEDEACMDWR